MTRFFGNRARPACWAVVSLGMFFLAGVRAEAAENEGQADLDHATEVKLGAESLDDLNLVINLSQSAINRGLDATNTDFAKKLLASTLIQRATALCKPIFDQNPPDVRWNRLRQAALIDLERANKNDSSSPEAYYLISRLNSLPGGNRKQALEAAGEAIKLAGSDDRVRAKSLVLRANLTDDKDKQLADYNEALKLEPNEAESLRARGVYYLLQDKPELALKDLEAAVKADPKQVDSFEAEGLVLTILKKYDEAIAAFDKVIELAPEASVAYLHRARARFAKGDAKKALEDLNKAAEMDSDNAGVLLLRARVHQQLGDVKEAQADIEDALKDHPGASQAVGLQAILAAGNGDFQQAINDVQELRKIAPDNVQLTLQLASVYTLAKQFRHAIETYNDVLTADNKNFAGYRGRGDAYLSIGKQAEALSNYEEALKLEPEDTGILNNLAWVLCTSPDDKLRDGKRAIELAKKACDLTENKQAHILSTMAAAYAETGDWENAIKWSKMAVEAGAPDVKAELEKELKSYEDKKPTRELQNEPEDGKPAKTDEAKPAETKPDDKSAKPDDKPAKPDDKPAK
ncbi:MAG TPA: tetratricopeptide repeat protein [Pirellulales bacterium]|nr:tetratricopeptide repeat protein [Pirellulales bacterium]